MEQRRERAADEALLEGPGLGTNESCEVAAREMSRRKLLKQFLIMSLAFSLNHGTVTALIALASSSLGKALGNVSSGLLYLIYTLTAAFAANVMTSKFGPKKTLVLGLSIYCMYVASYLIAFIAPKSSWGVVLIGSAFGGVAAGSIWPAQGVYFAVCAELYSGHACVSREEANSCLGGYFAATYLGCEVTMKLLSSIVPEFLPNGTEVLFALFTVLAIASVAAISTIDSLNDEAPKQATEWGKNAMSAVKLLLDDPVCACMVPFNFAFGFGSAFVNGYFNAAVVAPGVGKNAIGFIAAILVGSATLCSLVYGRLGQRIGNQTPIVVWGALCFAGFALVNLAVGAKDLGHWIFLVLLAILFGSGRSTWEGAFKATFADYFPKEKAAAFANVQLQSGIASTIGFFLTSSSVSSMIVGLVACVCALTALFAQLYARSLYKARLHAAGTSVRIVGDNGSSQDIV